MTQEGHGPGAWRWLVTYRMAPEMCRPGAGDSSIRRVVKVLSLLPMPTPSKRFLMVALDSSMAMMPCRWPPWSDDFPAGRRCSADHLSGEGGGDGAPCPAGQEARARPPGGRWGAGLRPKPEGVPVAARQSAPSGQARAEASRPARGEIVVGRQGVTFPGQGGSQAGSSGVGQQGCTGARRAPQLFMPAGAVWISRTAREPRTGSRVKARHSAPSTSRDR